MGQVFRPSANTVSRVSIAALLLLLGAVGFLALGVSRSQYATYVGITREQPVPFSHQHHVAGLGIDCRYCHTSVEKSGFAGIPPSETCMNCHSQIWNDAPMLAPVRESYRTGKPLHWNRVHDLPDFVYFNHSIHVAQGVGCSTCHGRVDQMPLMMKAQSLFMKWCLECHREPEKFIRPREQVFEMNWPPEGWDQAIEGPKLVKAYHVQTDGGLTNCYTCHR